MDVSVEDAVGRHGCQTLGDARHDAGPQNVAGAEDVEEPAATSGDALVDGVVDAGIGLGEHIDVRSDAADATSTVSSDDPPSMMW